MRITRRTQELQSDWRDRPAAYRRRRQRPRGHRAPRLRRSERPDRLRRRSSHPESEREHPKPARRRRPPARPPTTTVRFVAGHAVPGNRTIDVIRSGLDHEGADPGRDPAAQTTNLPDIACSPPPFPLRGTSSTTRARRCRESSSGHAEREKAREREDERRRHVHLYVEKEEPDRSRDREPKGFEKWGGGPDARVEIGTKNVHIVLRRSADAHVQGRRRDQREADREVRASARSEADEELWSSAVEKEIQFENHPGGLVRVPLSNPFVVVDAPDHAPTETDVMPDERDGDVQTIALRPGARSAGDWSLPGLRSRRARCSCARRRSTRRARTSSSRACSAASRTT